MHHGDAKAVFPYSFQYRQRIRIKLCVVPLVSGDAWEWMFSWGFSPVSSSVVPNPWSFGMRNYMAVQLSSMDNPWT